MDYTSSPVPGLTRNIQKGEVGKRDRSGQKEIKQEPPCKHQTGHLAPRDLSAFRSVFILAWAAGLFEVKGGQFDLKTKAPFPFIPREREEGRESREGDRCSSTYRGRGRAVRAGEALASLPVREGGDEKRKGS